MVSCKDYVRRHGGSFFPDGDWRDRLLAPLYSPCFASISDIFQVFPFEQNRPDSSAVHKGNSNYDLKVCKSFSEMRERHIGLSGIRMLNKKKKRSGKMYTRKKILHLCWKRVDFILFLSCAEEQDRSSPRNMWSGRDSSTTVKETMDKKCCVAVWVKGYC